MTQYVGAAAFGLQSPTDNKQTDQEGQFCSPCGSGPLAAITERRMLSELLSILENDSLPLRRVLSEQRGKFSNKLVAERRSIESHRKSFIPVSIKLVNSFHSWK